MSCHEVRDRIHDYLDGELSAYETDCLEEHLGHCRECREREQGLRWMRQALAVRENLPRVCEEQVWKRIQGNSRRTFGAWCFGLWDRFFTFWRDLDSQVVWSQLSAVPITVGFFLVILMQFPLSDVQIWTYPAFTMRRQPSSVFIEPYLIELQARHTMAAIDGLMTTAWKIPYEDSLSLLAEVKPGGHAEIEDVLQYPKSPDLLEAVGSTLRDTEFQMVQNQSNPVVIYSFQKIDVYSDQPAF